MSSRRTAVVLAIGLVATLLATPLGAVTGELRSYLMDRGYFDRGYARLYPYPVTGVRSVIIPHHLLAVRLAAQAVSGIRQRVDRVILIGPNHFARGQGDFIATRLSWDTPYGTVATDAVATQYLADTGVVTVDDLVISHEHSLSGLMPLVRRSFPQASVVSIAIRQDASQESLDELYDVLRPLLNNTTILISSIDFSHETIDRVAQARDAVSWDVISSYDLQRLPEIDADCWQCAQIAMRAAPQHQAHLVANSNAAQLTGRYDLPVTSYLTIQFK